MFKTHWIIYYVSRLQNQFSVIGCKYCNQSFSNRLVFIWLHMHNKSEIRFKGFHQNVCLRTFDANIFIRVYWCKRIIRQSDKVMYNNVTILLVALMSGSLWPIVYTSSVTAILQFYSGSSHWRSFTVYNSGKFLFLFNVFFLFLLLFGIYYYYCFHLFLKIGTFQRIIFVVVEYDDFPSM